MTQSPGTLTSRGPPRVTETCGLRPDPMESLVRKSLWGWWKRRAIQCQPASASSAETSASLGSHLHRPLRKLKGIQGSSLEAEGDGASLPPCPSPNGHWPFCSIRSIAEQQQLLQGPGGPGYWEWHRGTPDGHPPPSPSLPHGTPFLRSSRFLPELYP